MKKVAMSQQEIDRVSANAFMRGFGVALAEIWKLHHDASMIRTLMTANGFSFADFRDVGLLKSTLDAIHEAISVKTTTGITQ